MVSLAVLGFIRCQSWLNFQNIGQGLDHLSRIGSILEHTPCTMSLGMRTHGNRQFWCLWVKCDLSFGMFCFAEIAVSSDKSIIIRALGCARTQRLWALSGERTRPTLAMFPCRFFGNIRKLLVTTFLTDDYAFMSKSKVVSVVRSRPIIINESVYILLVTTYLG